MLAMNLPGSVKSVLAHPAGPFTSNIILLCFILLVFFWAPAFKWMITFANIGDFKKPAENISAN
jgi:hypothetical protein